MNTLTTTCYRSPHNGEPLVPDAAHLLSDGELLWPTFDDIAYLRPQHDLRAQAVALIRQNRATDALILLLQDQDPFAPLPPPDASTLRTLLEDNTITLREAMQMLNYGPVADYFAYRSVTPTFLSGLSLLQHVVQPSRPVLEVACGMGHFLSVLETNGLSVTGIDLVFSKLWLARRYMKVQGSLICGDITQPAPLTTDQPTSVFCHDAFYFFEQQTELLNTLRSWAIGGPIAIGHVHTNAVNHHVAGFPRSFNDYQRMATPNALFADDRRLVHHWLAQQPIGPPDTDALSAAEAVAWVEGTINNTLYPLDHPATPLQHNPLLRVSGEAVTLQWPTERFQREYEADAGYLHPDAAEVTAITQPDSLSKAQQDRFFRRRILVDLPERW